MAGQAMSEEQLVMFELWKESHPREHELWLKLQTTANCLFMNQIRADCQKIAINLDHWMFENWL